MGKKIPNTAGDFAKWAETNGPEPVTEADKCEHIAKMLQKEYGTLKRRKMLAVHLLKNCDELNVTDRCLVAGVGRTEWYRQTQMPEFSADLVKLAIAYKGHYAPKILKRFIRNAEVGGKEGDGDTRAQIEYLRDVGVLSKPESGSKGDNVVNVTVIQAEREEKLARGLSRFGVKVDNGADDN